MASSLAPAINQTPPIIRTARVASPTEQSARQSRSWLDRWHARHSTLAAATTICAVIAINISAVPSLSAQLIVLAALLALTGLPHGAADHLPARNLFAPQFGRFWPYIFGALYLGVATFVLLAWLAFPPAALTLFLLMAVQHFGAEDANPRVYGHRSHTGIALHGLIPVAGPVLFHVSETAQLFAWLLPGTPVETVERVLATLAIALPVLVAAWLALALYHVVIGGRERRRLGLEIVVLTLLMAAAPPLLAFGIYFCGWHAVRHMLGEAHGLEPNRPWHGLARFARHAAPVTVATLVLGAVGYAVTAAGVTPTVALTRVLFIGLAAIAVPHIAMRAIQLRVLERSASR